MSWSVTINNLPEFKGFDADVIESMMSQHIAYPQDMMTALEMARKTGLKSAVLTGMRTPNPYGGDEVIDISVRGMVEATDFNAMMRRIIEHGPDETT
jgi:hypothetical protein